MCPWNYYVDLYFSVDEGAMDLVCVVFHNLDVLKKFKMDTEKYFGYDEVYLHIPYWAHCVIVGLARCIIINMHCYIYTVYNVITIIHTS